RQTDMLARLLGLAISFPGGFPVRRRLAFHGRFRHRRLLRTLAHANSCTTSLAGHAHPDHMLHVRKITSLEGLKGRDINTRPTRHPRERGGPSRHKRRPMYIPLTYTNPHSKIYATRIYQRSP